MHKKPQETVAFIIISKTLEEKGSVINFPKILTS